MCLFSDNYSPPAFTFQGLPGTSQHFLNVFFFLPLKLCAFPEALLYPASPAPNMFQYLKQAFGSV